jgi:L-alanine-DL-glutamate epimerase-like enolase superfamily enzyme
MKITDYRIETFSYSRGRRLGDANDPVGREIFGGSLLFIETDVGITGIATGGGAAVKTLFPLIEGEDPRSVTGLWRRMVDFVFKGGNVGGANAALSAIDMALWDIKAKANDEPLWRTFGALEPRVKPYASGLDMPLADEDLAAFYTAFAERGVDGGKLKVGLDQDADIRRLGIMRDCLARVAKRPYLMVDANEFWSPKQAIRKISEMEEHFDLFWVEEPARRWDFNGLRQVSQGIRAAVASGENLQHIGDYLPLIARRAVDVVQFSSGGNSGFTGVQQIAHMAHGFELPVSVIGGPGNLMSHLAAALPNHNMMEVKDLAPPPCWRVDNSIDDGWIHLGNEPGLGITVDEAKLAEMQANPPTPAPDETPYSRRAGAGLYDNPPQPGEAGWA